MGLLGNGGAVTRGEILYKGIDVLAVPPEALRKLRGPEMSMVFQDCAASLCPIRTIGDQLYEAVKEHGKESRKETEAKAISYLGKMNLPDGKRILASYPFELSGGMNQRVGIAMAVMLEPQLLFADEPTSALAVVAQAQTAGELKKLKDERNTAIVIVTHNLGLVSRLADTVAVMREGRVEEYGAVKDVIFNPQKAYTKELIRAVPRIGRGR